jgi:preprotein translocase subunit YajC
VPQLILTLLLIAVGWFLLIRPQQARIRTQRAMVEALRVGDRVVTAGGIHGTITALHDETVRVEVAPGVELTVARPAIMRQLADGRAEGGDHGRDEDVNSQDDEVAEGDGTAEEA